MLNTPSINKIKQNKTKSTHFYNTQKNQRMQ